MSKIIKIALALLLFLCLADMPYGFYQLVRFLALIGFAFLAYDANENNRKNETLIYGALALLYQPLLKISLGRELWNVVDVVVGLGLLGSLMTRKRYD
jgi:hypothetical protein